MSLSRGADIDFGALSAPMGDIRDILVQSRWNKAAAMRFFRKLFKTWGQPRVIFTDKLRPYVATKADLAPGIEQRQHKRIEQSRRGLAQTHAAAREDHGSLEITRLTSWFLMGVVLEASAHPASPTILVRYIM
ncbi:DDE-type integrase/transposase/recombinase [Phaeovulum sp. NW3]|uniref:DDE-type integrase/transposase/recombinase n=1 Tax=Phaeovulum sp. NW3 TaxID=2934933 RepID=UPI0020223E64|nr:DDE-type integrase/transposase/recombinase [Phaeovulum sp. NW3]MCL7466673.1 DDE-type integrase/transposase/recombinase [Phaeovulum sp. NW3]